MFVFVAFAPRSVPQDSDLAHRREDYVEITCSDRARFRQRTSAHVFAAYDLLLAASTRAADGQAPRSQLQGLEMSLGMNFNPSGMLADQVLRSVVDPVRAFTYDWVHSYLQDGVFTIEVTELLRACAPFGVTFSALREYLKDQSWCFPSASKAKQAALYRVFDSWRSSAADSSQAGPMEGCCLRQVEACIHSSCVWRRRRALCYTTTYVMLYHGEHIVPMYIMLYHSSML